MCSLLSELVSFDVTNQNKLCVLGLVDLVPLLGQQFPIIYVLHLNIILLARTFKQIIISSLDAGSHSSQRFSASLSCPSPTHKGPRVIQIPSHGKYLLILPPPPISLPLTLSCCPCTLTQRLSLPAKNLNPLWRKEGKNNCVYGDLYFPEPLIMQR